MTRRFSMDNLRRVGSGSKSPLNRADSETEISTDQEPSTDQRDEQQDPLDMRDHDEMIRETLRHVHQTHAKPKNLFGCSINRSNKFYIDVHDEVRFGLWLLFIIGFLIAVIFLIVVAANDDVHVSDTVAHPHGTSLIIAGVFGILSCVVSFIQIAQHLQAWTHPPSQRLVIRILLMIPIYSISAWLALWQLEYSVYIDFLRVCYEAFVLYSFMVLLTTYLGGHEGTIQWMMYKEPIKWIIPMNCLPRCAPTSNFLWYLKYSCLQYAVIAPFAMLIAVICEALHAYGDGELNFDQGYLWVTILINCSQIISLYGLAWLYVIMKKELGPFSPILKFAAIKAVVFATFWQGVLLAVLVKAGAITDSENFSVGHIQVGLQDFIVSIEMFIFACLHKYCFGAETYADGTMALLMEQRATFIAQLAYKRAVEMARKELAERDALFAAQGKDRNVDVTIEKSVGAFGASGALTADEIVAAKEAAIANRAKQILHDATINQSVLFDGYSSMSALPATSDEYHRDHRAHADLIHETERAVEEEMNKEAAVMANHANGSINQSMMGSHVVNSDDVIEMEEQQEYEYV